MGLQAVYEGFLASPNPLNLADDATLQYVTTLKSFSQQGGIIKHVQDQNANAVTKKAEKVISAVEGLTSVAVIVETTLLFVSNGGAYLPGLDTFIIDKSATLPITHFVHFDKDDKITQIRLSWDQGDLLKQVEVIGTRGKNWPVYEGKDQINMITKSTNMQNEVNPAPTLSPRGRSRNGAGRSASPSKKFIRDPHASLNLYQPEEEERKPSAPNAVAPRESHRPPPREMSDLFAAGHEDYQGASPRKVVNETVVRPKGGGHKKFQPSRLFDDEDEPVKEAKIYKTNPARYNHFDLGDAYDDAFQYKTENQKPSDVPIRPKGGNRSQHTSQWTFEDFVTPEKIRQKVRDQDVVHFSYDQGAPGDGETPRPAGKSRKDQEAHFELQDNGTPVIRPIVHKPRKDAANHFDFTDEPSPGPRSIIARTKDAAKIYSDPVFGQEESDQPLQPVARNARRDMANQWEAKEESPAPGVPAKPAGKARKDFQSSWDF